MVVLASREHTCIHPHVSVSNNKNEDCRKLILYKEVTSKVFLSFVNHNV
jgi:Fanconi anemia group J protein